MAAALLCSQAAPAAIEAFLERDTISLNETVRLIIRSDDANTAASPDLSVLRQNFTVLGTSTSQNISITGARQVSEKTWVTELEPKSVGIFTIPAITVGNGKTRPVRLKVLPENRSQAAQDRDIFLELDLSDAPHRVQQQILMTVRLYLGVNLLDGNLTDPGPKDAQVRRVGQDTQFTANVNGRSYRVIERKYALFPENSGPLHIPPLRFQGLASDDRSAGQTFSRLFNQGIRVSASTRTQVLDILPSPADYDGGVWLPASNVDIVEIGDPQGQATVGQPVTRRIQVRAAGLTAEQLPDLQFAETPSFRQYPDLPVRETLFDGRHLVGTVTRSIAFIANRPGALTLPPLTLAWWDTDTATRETAELPASTIQVQAAGQPGAPAQPGSGGEAPTTATAPATGAQEPSGGLPPPSGWMWTSLAMLAGWIFTGLYLWRKIRRLGGADPGNARPAESAEQDTGRILSGIRKACADRHPRQARQLTIQLARSLWGPDYHGGLQEMAARIGTGPLPERLGELDSVLFAPGNDRPESWDGEAYARCLAEWLRSMRRRNDAGRAGLPELYPTSS